MKRSGRVAVALGVLGLGALATWYALTQLGLIGDCTVTVRNVGSAGLEDVAVRFVFENPWYPRLPWADQPLGPGESLSYQLEGSSESHVEVHWVDAAGTREHWRLPIYIVGGRYRAVHVDLATGRAPDVRLRTRPRGPWEDVRAIRLDPGADQTAARR